MVYFARKCTRRRGYRQRRPGIVDAEMNRSVVDRLVGPHQLRLRSHVSREPRPWGRQEARLEAFLVVPQVRGVRVQRRRIVGFCAPRSRGESDLDRRDGSARRGNAPLRRDCRERRMVCTDRTADHFSFCGRNLSISDVAARDASTDGPECQGRLFGFW